MTSDHNSIIFRCLDSLRSVPPIFIYEITIGNVGFDVSPLLEEVGCVKMGATVGSFNVIISFVNFFDIDESLQNPPIGSMEINSSHVSILGYLPHD